MNLPFSKWFEVFKLEQEGHTGHFIWFDEFCKLLRTKIEVVKGFNVRRSMKQGVRIVDGREAVSVKETLRYIFYHVGSDKGCDGFASQIEAELLADHKDPDELDLYRTIVKTKLQQEQFFRVCTAVPLDENNLVSLNVTHKSEFTADEWRMICWFEHHFYKSNQDVYYNLSMREIMKLKYDKFQTLCSFKESGETLKKISSEQLKEKWTRYKAAESPIEENIVASARHVPGVIEDEVKHVLEKLSKDVVHHVVCFDGAQSVSKNCIQIVIGMTTEQYQDENKDLYTWGKEVFVSVSKRHNVNVEKLIFVSEDNLKAAFKDETVNRSELRDQVENQDIDVIYEWNAWSMGADVTARTREGSNCVVCFSSARVKPLCLENFNILSEWYLETPIEVQLLLEVFVGPVASHRCRNMQSFYSDKVWAFYCIFDFLLKVVNKNFPGLFLRYDDRGKIQFAFKRKRRTLQSLDGAIKRRAAPPEEPANDSQESN